ncbi:AraC family transcriptional regulator [Verrucomicrobium sp. GAS474]|uniref:helix-turn-helix domain-containing protein n=1 Tax=Verrucomicrobium sp. GAS474 TaxID=1882831 RepID=UPI0012FF5BD0|nr:AraC family transcriptional regulator [Verrucomicrobium sp. GAS474]
MITQWPGEKPNYGPLPLDATWDEIYFLYDARTVPQLRKRGFFSDPRPVWPITNLEGVLATLEELRSLIRLPDPASVVDRIDRICERMILESLAPPPGRGDDGDTQAIVQIEAALRAHPEKDYDFDALARANGLSPSTLRRQWSALYALPPNQHLIKLRLAKARRLLVESDARIGEIAQRVGFADVLYFSRRFRLMTGLSASDYRKRYRLRPL